MSFAITQRQIYRVCRVRKFFLLTTFLFCFNSTASLSAQVQSADLLRASVIEKIARFISWPEWSADHFNLCVSAKAPLLPAVQSYFENETLASKPVKLVRFERLSELKECQLIYIHTELTEQLSAILELTKRFPILLIAETKNAVEQGAHIDYYIEDNKINLEVNREALSISGLSSSYHLLKVARLVDSH